MINLSRWKYTFRAQATTTQTASAVEYGVHEGLIRSLITNGHSVKFARLILVETTLAQPSCIIKGWGRPDKEDCWVYVGHPTKDYRSASIETPAPPDMVFLVFVLPDGTVDDWGWRPKDINQPTMPKDVKGEIVWSNQ